MITSRVSSKAQTTLPRAVQAALGVKDGDQLAYEIKAGAGILTKPSRRPTIPAKIATLEARELD